MFSTEILLYVVLGFVAQLFDGALGMAYGLIASSALLATGTPPALASASIHAAEIVTTGLAGASHVWNRNIDWELFKRLAPAGIVGGVDGRLCAGGTARKRCLGCWSRSILLSWQF